ncbi:molybdopterin biosynthesis protein [Salipaludibacillus aurantiacus]|uniref:Molybdopterin molybdenumtransferase n=1 Tax=Salipaludibacillus aurantiacus TaxID=1601833 RepID=A0A1H9WJK0_9BACI|nr:molybdopterin biosynthesis protein [Salipaludibacillus aurantiacus]SES34116.1 putative molybdopterin biosynthesis protein [Salipaludibacillus aurantiacus]
MKTKQERTIYLEDTPRQDALERCLNLMELTDITEDVEVQNAVGRITAEPVYACASNPHFHASAMDGIAVRAKDTETAHESNPLRLKEEADFEYVDTGNPIPHGFDAVIMIEDVNEVTDGELEIIAPAVPWQRIRPIGEDITYGEMLLSQGHKIRPVDAGALLAASVKEVKVIRKPAVRIYPSGSELVSPHEPLKSGKLIEFNGTIFSEMVKEWGGEPELMPIVKDDPEAIRAALSEGVEAADIVIINAGSSAGSKDFTAGVIEEMGEVITHGIATRPGKPVVIGKVNGTIVIGIPGYPVSAYFVMEWFVEPLICRFLDVPVPEREKLTVHAGRRIVSSMGSEDFIRVNIGYVNGRFVANPLTRSASVTMSLVKADGIVTLPADQLGVEQGEKMTAVLTKPRTEIQSSVLFSGSHDLSVDILSSHLKKEDGLTRIIASHTGSMAGLMAIKRGEAHLTGLHLFDPATGTYNLPYIEKFLRNMKLVLLPFLQRQQGLMVPKGNPYSIQNISHIAEKEARYVNRQKGAGTRMLFDHLLKENGLKPENITGYNREMFTHLSVAAEVKMEARAVGMGIYSAAQAMDLDFIPVEEESYDLLMTQEFFESKQGRLLFHTLKSRQFKESVEQLGGYTVNDNLEARYIKI